MPGSDVAPIVEALADLPQLLRSAEGWNAMVDALRARRSGTIDGAWGSAASLATAALGLEATSTLLVVLAHAGDVNPWARGLLSFSGQRPTIFPAWEEWPPPKAALDEVPGQRLRVLQHLLREPPRLLLTTFAALIQPVPSRAELEARARRLSVGESIDLDELAHWLVAQGF